MRTYTITHRITGKILFEGTEENLSKADLSGADLSGTDLSDATFTPGWIITIKPKGE